MGALPILPLRELVRISKNFIGKEWDVYSKEQKLNWINSYRKVESETNKQIKEHGSVTAWYESGIGRLLNLD